MSIGRVAPCLALVAAMALALAGCASRPATRAADPADDRFAIARTISDTARAVSAFGRTADPEAVLRFYAPDYDGVQDGDRQTLADLRRLLDELKQRIDEGVPIEMVARTTNIRVNLVNADTGWATYDLLFALGAGGRLALQQQARCSAVYRKAADAWLVRHEHCSTRRGDER